MGRSGRDRRGRMHLAATLAVVAAVVLAGCGGFLSDGGGTERLTPAPVPTIAPEPAEGVSEAGVEPLTIADRHRSALLERSYTNNVTVVWETANGTTYTRRTVTRVGAGGRPFEVVGLNTAPTNATNRSAYHLWYDGNVSAIETTHADGSVEYARFESAPPVEIPRSQFVAAIFDRLTRQYVATSRTGSTVVRGRVEAVDSLRLFGELRNETNGTMAARIHQDGYVASLVLTFDAAYRGRPVEARLVMSIERPGRTDLSPPAWFDRTSAASPQIERVRIKTVPQDWDDRTLR